MKKLITLVSVLVSVNAAAVEITSSDVNNQEIVTEKFYQVSTLSELNKLAKQCYKLADSEDKKRVCSSSYMDRKYSL